MTERSLIDLFMAAKEPTCESSAQTVWWAGAALVSAMMNRNVWTNVRSESVADRLFGNLFILLVGEPGVGKTDAIKRARPLAIAAKVRMGPDDITGERLAEFTKTFRPGDDWGKDEAVYGARAKRVGKADRTEQKDGTARGEPNGTLALFLNEFDHLFHGGSADAIKRILTDFYDCREEAYIRETYQHGKQVVEQMCMSLIGAATPALMSRIYTRPEWQEGLPSRFVYVWAGDTPSYKDSFEADPTAEAALTAALKATNAFILEHNKIGWDSDAAHLRKSWRKIAINGGPVHTLLGGYKARRYVTACKLALVLAVARCSRKIAAGDWAQAVAKIEETERDIDKVLAQAGGNELRAVMVWTAEWVRARGHVDEAALRRKLGQTLQPQLVNPVIDELSRSKMINHSGEHPTRMFSAGISREEDSRHENGLADERRSRKKKANGNGAVQAGGNGIGLGLAAEPAAVAGRRESAA